MMSNKTLKLVTAALLAALTCIATMIIQIPTPVTSGYIHLGDGFVILSGILLGPAYGAAAAGIGSMLADLLSGYAAYAPITLTVKALAALFASLIFHALQKKGGRFHAFPAIAGGSCAAIIVALGYFAAEAVILGYGTAAAASIPHNLAQGVFGILICVSLTKILSRVPFLSAVRSSKP